MPVASRLQQQGMEHAITRMFDRMKAIIPDPELTHDEVTQLWAPKEHHTILKTAGDIAYLSAHDRDMEVTTPFSLDGVTRPSISFKMREHHGFTPPLIPRAPEWQHDAPEETKEKVRVWLEKRLEVGRQFGMVKHVFKTIMRDFPTGAAARYVWPSILLLARNAPAENVDDQDMRKTIKFGEICDAWAVRHAEFKAVPHPKLSLAFRQALRDTGAVLTAASMLNDDHVRAADVPRGVIVEAAGDSFPFEDVNITRM